MWILYASGSAFFAGITSILAKCGIKKTDSTVATAIRTVVVLIFSWLMVLVAGTTDQIHEINGKTLLFLVLSGMATGASWLCYFHALQIGNVNKVVPVDKSSTVLTILLALIFFREGISLMIEKKETTAETDKKKEKHGWFFYACGSAIFASLTSILGKVGITGIDSNLGTAIRTGVVLVMAWLMVFVTGKQHEVKRIAGKEAVFICCSGIATGASWLCYYKALQIGPVSGVAPIDKLSVLVTVAFSYIVFGEKLTKKSLAGLIIMTLGTIAMAVCA